MYRALYVPRVLFESVVGHRALLIIAYPLGGNQAKECRKGAR